MLPENELFKNRQNQLMDQRGKLLLSAEMRKEIDSIVTHLREHGESVSAPGLIEIRVAVQRELNADGIVFPKGKVYSSKNYETFTLGDSDVLLTEELGGFDYADPQGEPQESKPLDMSTPYASRMYAVTTEQEQGKVSKKVSEWLDGEQKISSKALIMTLTPQEAGKIFDIDSAIFVVVQATGGENYCYTLTENERKGKVIVQEALEDEWGQSRDKFGPIDTYRLKAVPATPEECVHIMSELKKADAFLAKNKPEVVTKKEKVKKRIGTLGTSISTKLKVSPRADIKKKI